MDHEPIVEHIIRYVPQETWPALYRVDRLCQRVVRRLMVNEAFMLDRRDCSNWESRCRVNEILKLAINHRMVRALEETLLAHKDSKCHGFQFRWELQCIVRYGGLRREYWPLRVIDKHHFYDCYYGDISGGGVECMLTIADKNGDLLRLLRYFLKTQRGLSYLMVSNAYHYRGYLTVPEAITIVFADLKSRLTAKDYQTAVREHGPRWKEAYYRADYPDCQKAVEQVIWENTTYWRRSRQIIGKGVLKLCRCLDAEPVHHINWGNLIIIFGGLFISYSLYRDPDIFPRVLAATTIGTTIGKITIKLAADMDD